MTGKVAIILINYNNHGDTLECIKSLRSSTYDNFVIIVVDNKSSENSVDQLREEPNIILLESNINLGFGGGNNLGIKKAIEIGCEFIWVLNNDTVVMPDSLYGLVKCLENDPNLFACGSIIYYADSFKVQAYGGGRVNMILGIAPLLKKKGEIDYLMGASVFIRKSKIEGEVFSDSFFMYWEDTDLFFRMRQQGKKFVVCDNSIILHKESSSLGKFNTLLDRYYIESQLKFYKRYSKIYLIPFLIGGILRISNRIKNKKTKSAAYLLFEYVRMVRK